jgi:hypothetical protein
MRPILFTAALACGAVCTQATAGPADGWTVYTDLSIWQASDPVPIRQIDDDWSAYSPRAGRNAALMRNRCLARRRSRQPRCVLPLPAKAQAGAACQLRAAGTVFFLEGARPAGRLHIRRTADRRAHRHH